MSDLCGVLMAPTAWVITTTDHLGTRWWFGMTPAEGDRLRRRTSEPSQHWDYVPCWRTVQFATRELAEQHPISLGRTIEEVDRDYLLPLIMLVHSPGWHDET